MYCLLTQCCELVACSFRWRALSAQKKVHDQQSIILTGIWRYIYTVLLIYVGAIDMLIY